MYEHIGIRRIGDDRFVTTVDLHHPYGPVVPEGFVFDGMSSPKWTELVGIGDSDSVMLFCSAQHDYCYSGRHPGVSRRQADLWLYKNLRKLGCALWRASLIYASVRQFGEEHWKG